MGEGGRTGKPGQAFNQAPKESGGAPESAYAPANPSGVAGERRQVVQEALWRATDGRQGLPPMARIQAQARRAAASASQRAASMLNRATCESAGASTASAPIPGAWRAKLTGGPDAASRPWKVPIAGALLPENLRARMEPKLGADLSGVTVNTSAEAAEAASALGARAFTVGQDVYFGSGEFAPGSKEGDKLIAHELTHTVQGRKSGASVQRKGNGNEGEGKAKDPNEGIAKPGDTAENEGNADSDATAAKGEQVEVSQPEQPAEKEADRVADDVADKLYGGEQDAKTPAGAANEGADAEPAHSPQEAAPQVAAKLKAGAISLAPKAGAAHPPGASPPDDKPPTPEEFVALAKPERHPAFPAFQNLAKQFAPDIDALAVWMKVMDGLAKTLPATKLSLKGLTRGTPEYEKRAAEILAAQKPGVASFQEVASVMLRGRFENVAGRKSGFWSGGNPAKEYAAARGQTLETTEAGRIFDPLKLLNHEEAFNAIKPLWDALSREYARRVHGEIHAYMRWIGPTFRDVERPLVEARQKIPGGGLSLKYHALLGKKGAADPQKGTDLEEPEGGPFDTQVEWQAAIDAGKAKGRK